MEQKEVFCSSQSGGEVPGNERRSNMFDMVSNRRGEWYILKEVAPCDREIIFGPMTKEEAERKIRDCYIKEAARIIKEAVPLIQKSGIPLDQALTMILENQR